MVVPGKPRGSSRSSLQSWSLVQSAGSPDPFCVYWVQTSYTSRLEEYFLVEELLFHQLQHMGYEMYMQTKDNKKLQKGVFVSH